MPEAAAIEALVRAELDRMDKRVAAAIVLLLVVPRREDRDWDYGAVGQKYPCWIVVEHPASNSGIAYCGEGFGPGDPWGLLFLRGEHLSMGMDSGWFTTLADAFRESMACDLPPPPRYETA
jgi:hypothetical protein